ncbi:MAG: Acriflavin resistance protein [uncultured Sulfurovum sp.]|uniref:Acriflavin resistance protein n=1 Tax=uncultured Sulfurovum sp. TaxID=269237 RepID=A0A6S6SDI1_9BACT|nr:MAG: Acriflavin resistance protein [uncultured Sulfurovum sp.]
MENFVYNIISKSRYKWLVMMMVILSTIGAIMMLPNELVLAKMLPGKSANTFTIYIDTATSASIEETQRVTTCVQNQMMEEKEVLDMSINLGQGAALDYAGLVKGSAFKNRKNQAEVVINLTDKHERAEPSYMMVHRLRPKVQAKCGDIVPHTSIRFIEMPSGPPTLATIVIELFGKDDRLLRHTIGRVAKILKETEGLVDIDIMQDDFYTKYNLVPNKEKIIRAGLSVDQVNQITYLAFKGTAVAVKNTRDQQDQIPIFLRLSDETRMLNGNSINALRTKLSSLRLINREGMMIPLSEVVSVESIRSSPSIFRKNLKKYVSVTAECDMVSQVYPLLEARSIIIEKLSDEFNVTKVAGVNTYMFDLNLVDKRTGTEMLLRWDGEMKVSLDTFRDLGGAFIAALVLMFLLIVVYYKSFALSGIVLVGSFLSIIGVILGHWITNKIQVFFLETNFFLTATSLIGFISLMGISARSSLLLIDFTKSLIEEGMEKKSAIAIATATRAKPIMLTSIAIILGSLLLATDPIFGGLGISLIFGSMAATLVSLFFIPILMDNVRAILPKDYEYPEEEPNGYVAQMTTRWCVLMDNIREYFIVYRNKWDAKK